MSNKFPSNLVNNYHIHIKYNIFHKLTMIFNIFPAFYLALVFFNFAYNIDLTAYDLVDLPCFREHNTLT